MNNKILFIPMLILLPCLSATAAQTCVPEYPASTPTEDFTDNGDGTVTHNKTGLTWMRCALGQTWNGTTCIGKVTAMDWQTALDKATALNSSGGYAQQTDWRVPSVVELASIVETQCYDPAINLSVFPKPSRGYWSSSPDASYSDSAWEVSFYYGYSFNDLRDSNQAVRLVRGGLWFGFFDFQDQTGVKPGYKAISNTVTLEKVTGATSISIIGGAYSINGGAFTSKAGTVNQGNQVRVQATASTKYATAIQAILKIGDLDKKFTVTTKAKGQTCNYQTPAATPTSAFTDNGNSTLTDNKTGLTWMRCALGQTWKGTSCTEKAELYSVNDAQNAANSLNAVGFADQTDWRLPTKSELESIVEPQCDNSAVNASLFPKVSKYYWSSSPSAHRSDKTWYVNFNSGFSGEGNSDDAAAVRLVRDGQ